MTTPRLTTKTRKYKPEPGDEFIEISAISTAIAEERVVEIRTEDGAGYRGKIADLTHYVAPNGLYFIRLWGQEQGIFDVGSKKVLLKALTSV